MNNSYLTTQNRIVISIEMWSKQDTKKNKRNQHKEVDQWLQLKKEMYEIITGKPYSWAQKNYPVFLQESVEEEYREIADINLSRSWDRFTHVFIPKTKEGNELVQYLLDQTLRPTRKLKKASSYDRGINDHFRQLDKEHFERYYKNLL